MELNLRKLESPASRVPRGESRFQFSLLNQLEFTPRQNCPSLIGRFNADELIFHKPQLNTFSSDWKMQALCAVHKLSATSAVTEVQIPRTQTAGRMWLLPQIPWRLTATPTAM